jgi:acyl-homoserine-lactone acylase
MPSKPSPRLVPALLLAVLLLAVLFPAVGFGPSPAMGAVVPEALAPADSARWEALSRQVVIRRTDYGVAHIRAESLEAAAFALAWVQLEDYGSRVVEGLLGARGESTLHLGLDEGNLDADFRARRSHARAVETFHRLPAEVRAVYRGFAEGVNLYVARHPEEFAASVRPDFTGHDVLARDVSGPNWGAANRFLARVRGGETLLADPGAAEGNRPLPLETAWAEPGSNTWALGPSRTASGRAILMRNPHLSWDAGYYEAQVTVPGVMDFYGDFRIGGPFGILGGFNRHLGWSTTNNNPNLNEIYALEPHPTRPDHYLFDGAAVPLERVVTTVTFRLGEGYGSESRESWVTPLGPVIHRGDGKIFILRSAGDGEYRLGEQFLRMMTARSLDEWKEAMRMHARTQSNFTYADRDGNILYVWNAMHPDRPHAPGGDTLAIPATESAQVWTRYLSWDSLPRVKNPPGGYVRNDNDPFHHTNLLHILPPEDFPPDFPEPRVRLRSQHSLALVHGDDLVTLEEVVERKHSMGMLLADRVKDDLVRAVRSALVDGGSGNSSEDLAAAIALVERWDNTASAGSRGSVLFVEWWERYLAGAGRASPTPASAGFPAPAEALFRVPWSPDEPVTTPHGLADPERAVEAFAEAVEAVRDRWGSWDVAWGYVHRARHGGLDLPAGGCDGILGCFRVLWFVEDDDGLRRVRGGDGWVSAVEFTDVPRAYTVLAYGQSAREDSPHHTDQLQMFVDGRMKPIAFSEEEIRARLQREYRPGER